MRSSFKHMHRQQGQFHFPPHYHTTNKRTSACKFDQRVDIHTRRTYQSVYKYNDPRRELPHLVEKPEEAEGMAIQTRCSTSKRSTKALLNASPTEVTKTHWNSTMLQANQNQYNINNNEHRQENTASLMSAVSKVLQVPCASPQSSPSQEL